MQKKFFLRDIYYTDVFSNFPYVFLIVNLAHEPLQELQGDAMMSGPPQNSNWAAKKAVDGNINQSDESNSCAIMDITRNYSSVWWKVRLNRRFNIAYIEIFLRRDSMYREHFSHIV